MQIPGVDQGLADALIASRPYTDNEAFLITLGESVSTDDLERAICFLDYEA
jgi:dTDP-glucose pyrophosphorylase